MNTNTNLLSEKIVLNDIVANYCYRLLLGVAEQQNAHQQNLLLVDLGSIYSILLKELTRNETQFFPNSYTRSVFVLDNYQIPRPLSAPLKKLYVLTTRLSRQRIDYKRLGKNDFLFCLKGLSRFIQYLSHLDPPQNLEQFYAELPDSYPDYALAGEQHNINPSQLVPVLQVVVIEKGVLEETNPSAAMEDGARPKPPEFRLKAFDNNHEPIVLLIKGAEWVYLHKLIWKYARLALADMQYLPKQSEQTPHYQTTPNTLITLEPDYLYDASVVAECRLRKQETPLWYMCRRFYASETNYFFLRGALVNDYLDQVLMGQKADAAEIFNRLLQRNPTYSLIIDEQDRQKLLEEVKSHFLVLQNKFVRAYIDHDLSLEPTFISEIYGLRGRLDLMVAYDEQPNRRDVIELKTSKDPKKAEYKLIAEKDLLQATCYNLLLDSVYPNRNGTSAILYSAADLNDNPLRNAPNDAYTKQRFMQLRNKLARLDYVLCQQPETVLQAIHLVHFKNAGLWNNQENNITHFSQLLQNANDYEKAYFYAFVRFVACEQRAARIGANHERSGGGFAGLWNSSAAEKEREYKLLAYLTYQKTIKHSLGHDLYFDKTPQQTAEIVTFRVGDFVLLYPQEPDGTLKPTQHQIVKATIKELGKNHVILSPINQYLAVSFFEKHNYWAVESEIVETGFDSMLVSLRQFLELPAYKKQLLLGQREPQFEEVDPYFSPQLKYQQNLVLNRALAAKDYFLLQGPPGTGKTKVMLKTLVERLLADPKERIVLLAFTNRAVDEMCESLSMIEPQILFLRLGHGATTEHKHALLAHYAHGHSIPEIRQKIGECRVYVATVLTWQRNTELHNRLAFTTAIIDEASQLLEPQIIGIVGQVKRFILIGDEKQLPAVVAQTDQPIVPDDPLLAELGINNLCNALFERLLLNCQAKGWTQAYGMLCDQGRMHHRIEQFPNKYYYGGKLLPLSEWQTDEHSELHDQSPENLNKMGYQWLPVLQKSRLLFINTPTENRKNANRFEADLAAQIAQELAVFYGDALTDDSIGIITPYRAQIAEIRHQLTDELLEFISVDTVERYQGSQRRVIILSLAVNHVHQLNKLHVLNHDGTVDKKLNVALTRAKAHLIVIGNSEVLQQSPIYKVLIDHFKTEGLFLEP